MLKEQQFSDLQTLKEEKVQLTDTARDLAERFEDVCEQNDEIIARLVDYWLSLFCVVSKGKIIKTSHRLK